MSRPSDAGAIDKELFWDEEFTWVEPGAEASSGSGATGPDEILRQFVAEAETTEVANSGELQKIYTPEVVSALGSIVTASGFQPKNISPELKEMKRLVVRSGRTKVIGEAGIQEDGMPSPIYLAEHRRNLFRFKRQKWAVLASNGSLFSAAVNGRGFFMPSNASEEAIETYINSIGERTMYSEPGGPETGFEMAGKAVRERQTVMNGFLKTVAYLTKELVSVQASN